MLSELFFVAVLLFVALVTMLLSTAGVYALMSFLVAQRTREIGIRTALGADPARVVAGVFARALVQLGLGTVVGLGFVAFGLRDVVAEGAARDLMLAAGGVSAVLLVVGLIGCAIPVARALRIEPMEALGVGG
jgi:ABC-type antimicrobial peptide transport system permease subunit